MARRDCQEGPDAARHAMGSGTMHSVYVLTLLLPFSPASCERGEHVDRSVVAARSYREPAGVVSSREVSAFASLTQGGAAERRAACSSALARTGSCFAGADCSSTTLGSSCRPRSPSTATSSSSGEQGLAFSNVQSTRREEDIAHE